MDDEEFWNKSNIQSFSFDEDENVSFLPEKKKFFLTYNFSGFYHSARSQNFRGRQRF